MIKSLSAVCVVHILGSSACSQAGWAEEAMLDFSIAGFITPDIAHRDAQGLSSRRSSTQYNNKCIHQLYPSVGNVRGTQLGIHPSDSFDGAVQLFGCRDAWRQLLAAIPYALENYFFVFFNLSPNKGLGSLKVFCIFYINTINKNNSIFRIGTTHCTDLLSGFE